ncbi:MAG: hypothetical protein IJZ15_04340 [Oscillospiraceae bacterium]|nr:hypothetical protein [Oscillospiraceae bacterium]
MTGWDLPQSIEIGGKQWEIHADFRDILDIIQRLSAKTSEALYVCLALFYEDFEDLPEKCFNEAVEKMFLFIACGEEEESSPRPKTIDWEQDWQMIISDVNKVAGCEIRALPFCHWWTFISWFNGIGDGPLATVVSIREKKRKGKKLEDWEKEFYKNNRSKVDFKTEYSSSDNEQLSKWLGGGK